MSLYWIWYVLIGVLFAGYAILDGFDLGIGVLYPFVAKDERERSVLRSAIGPVWDGNEVWLITAGGALFAAFPFAYAFAFSGFYLAIMFVLFGLILRAVSLEFRHRDERWARLWDAFFFLGSLLPALLLGCAVGNLIRGVPMTVTGGPAGAEVDYAGTFLQLLNPYSLLVGVLGLAMFVVQGASWACLKTEGPLQARVAKTRSAAMGVFMVLIVATTIATAFVADEHVRRNVTSVAGWLCIVALVVGLVAMGLAARRRSDLGAFAASSLAVAALVGLWGNGNWPFLVPASKVTLQMQRADLMVVREAMGMRASDFHSSSLTLGVMLIIAAIGIPLVLAYTVIVYRTFAGKARGDY
jgi:cytochrome bd ubiquinol oxidase subunit II